MPKNMNNQNRFGVGSDSRFDGYRVEAKRSRIDVRKNWYCAINDRSNCTGRHGIRRDDHLVAWTNVTSANRCEQARRVRVHRINESRLRMDRPGPLKLLNFRTAVEIVAPGAKELGKISAVQYCLSGLFFFQPNRVVRGE